MPDFSELTTYFTPVVVIACLVVGYILKHSFKMIKNDFIPVILAVIGAVLNPIVCGVSVETVVHGALMGLASTGMHQAFTRFIEGTKTEDTEENVES